MRRSLLAVFLILLIASCSTSLVAVDAATNASTVTTKYEEWQDAQRNRAIPVKLYIPANLSAPLPVAIFSHGLGGSREAAQYLGEYWAEHGFIGVFIQHPGSDESFWRPGIDPANPPNRAAIIGRFKEQVKDPMHAVNRAYDVHFVIDNLERMNKSDPQLKGKFNLNAIAIAGHSYGSWTALTASGQRLITPGGRDLSSGDPRIKCAIYLSPTAPKRGQDPSVVYGSIQIPGLHFTGTLDTSPVNDTTADERRTAFDNITKSDQYLVILNGADHMVFGGRPRRAEKSGDKIQIEIIEQTTTAFLNAYLNHDEKAKEWLQTTARSYIKPYGTYELKTASK